MDSEAAADEDSENQSNVQDSESEDVIQSIGTNPVEVDGSILNVQDSEVEESVSVTDTAEVDGSLSNVQALFGGLNFFAEVGLKSLIVAQTVPADSRIVQRRRTFHFPVHYPLDGIYMGPEAGPVKGLESDFYSEDFDPISHALSRAPPDGNFLEYLKGQSDLRDTQLEEIEGFLTTLLAENQEAVFEPFKSLRQIEKDNLIAYTITKNARRRIRDAGYLTAAPGKELKDLAYKKKHLLELLLELEKLHEATELKKKDEALYKSNPTFSAGELGGEFMKLYSQLEPYAAMRDMAAWYDDVCPTRRGLGNMGSSADCASSSSDVGGASSTSAVNDASSSSAVDGASSSFAVGGVSSIFAVGGASSSPVIDLTESAVDSASLSPTVDGASSSPAVDGASSSPAVDGAP